MVASLYEATLAHTERKACETELYGKFRERMIGRREERDEEEEGKDKLMKGGKDGQKIYGMIRDGGYKGRAHMMTEGRRGQTQGWEQMGKE